MIDGLVFYVLEDEGGNVHAITGGWDAPTFPDGVGAWALRQCSERNESREGDTRGGIVFRFTPEELRVWLEGAGTSLTQAFPGETWATFGNSRRCGDVDYVYPGEWVWKPRGVAERLEYLRGELRAERISWGELAELQGLAHLIPADDLELREAAGLPEGDPFDGPDESFGVDPDLARDIERGK